MASKKWVNFIISFLFTKVQWWIQSTMLGGGEGLLPECVNILLSFEKHENKNRKNRDKNPWQISTLLVQFGIITKLAPKDKTA